MPIECRDIPTLLAAYLNGELDGPDREAFEKHSDTCQACAQALREEALFVSRIKDALATPPAPDMLRQRLSLALDGEDRAYLASVRRQRLAWALPGGAAIAAAAALVLLVLSRTGGLPESSPVAQEVIRQRFETIPVMRTGSRGELSRVAQEVVHVPIRPPRFAHPNVKLRGIGETQMLGRPSVVFVYEDHRSGKQNRVDLYVLDSRGLKLGGSSRREIDDRELWLSEQNGIATVSYKDDQGIGYVFRSDMSANELADLVQHSDLLLVLSPPTANE